MTDETPSIQGRYTAPDAVWALVRDDYLSGLSAPECCRRHGVGLAALRSRASREGWRRADQPWTPPARLDPWDEGVALEERVEGDLDRVDYGDLAWVAHRRMMRAVLRGDAAEALRWRRVEQMIQDQDAELTAWSEAEDALAFHRSAVGDVDALDVSDASDALDGVSATEPPTPGEPDLLAPRRGSGPHHP